MDLVKRLDRYNESYTLLYSKTLISKHIMHATIDFTQQVTVEMHKHKVCIYLQFSAGRR